MFRRTAVAAGATLALVAASFIALAAPASAAPPSEDNYANARAEVSEGRVADFINNAGATLEKYEPTTTPGGRHIRSTVWISWIAPANGSIDVDLTNSGVADTFVGIFTGSTMKKAKMVAYNDNASTTQSRSIIPSFAVTKGKKYHFQLGSVTSTSISEVGNIDWFIDGHYSGPANDDRSHATRETASHWTAHGTLLGTTLEPLENTDSGHNIDSAWWKWKSPGLESVVINTNGSKNDSPYLAVYGVGHDGTQVTSTRSVGGGSSVGNQAQVSFESVPDVTYYIAVGNSDSTMPQEPVTLNFAGLILGPIITKMSPKSGPLTGGHTITLTGHHLGAIDSATIGGLAVEHITLVSDTEVKLKLPAGFVKGPEPVVVHATTGGYSSLYDWSYTYK